MKELLYIIIGLAFLSVGPQLILGAIITVGIYYFLYYLFKGIAGGTDESSNITLETRTKQNVNVTEQAKRSAKKAASETAKRNNSYSANSYSGYRNSNYEDSYNGYGDWCDDDIPPDDEIHFRGTGAPFL